MLQVQEVPVVQAQDRISATLLRDELAWVEVGTDRASLGALSVEVDGAGP
jgi:hypothetical protein